MGNMPSEVQEAEAILSEPDALGSVAANAALGDLMLTFHVAGASFPSRTPGARWEATARDGGWQLWRQPVGEGWRGVPVTIVRAGAWHIYLLGELYGSSGQDSVSTALPEIVAGRRTASTLNGHFLLLAWDGETRRWHVWTNRFGTLHAYHATNGRRVAIGTYSFAAAHAASRGQLDWTGLTGFFACGFFLQDRTHFDDMRILRPASHYVFDEDGRLIQQGRYRQWSYQPDEKRSYDDTLAEFADILNNVVPSLTGEDRTVISLSGGLDSRTVLAAASSPADKSTVDHRLWSYSYGYTADSVETRISRELAARRRVPFRSYLIEPYLFARIDHITRSVEGFQDCMQCRQAAVVAELGDNADHLVVGHLGDLWLGGAGLESDGRRTFDEAQVLEHIKHKIKKGGRAWLLKHLCRKHIGDDDPESLIDEMLRQEMSDIRHIEDAEFQVKAFKIEQWVFRWTNTGLRMFQPAAFPRLPFYDTRLADFFCTVPASFMHGRRLQVDYLKRFAPDLAGVAWQVYDANLFRYQHYDSWLLPKRALKKAWRVLAGKRIVERNWERQLLNEAGRRGLEQHLLKPQSSLHELVSPNDVRSLLDDFYAAPFAAGRGYAVSMLLSFAAWLEQSRR